MEMPRNLSIIEVLPPKPTAAPALSLALRPLRVIEVLNPFRPDERKVAELEPLEGESLGAAVARAGYAVEQFEPSINGELVPAADVWRTVVRAGQDVVLYPRSAGGGLVRGISMLALMVFVSAITMGFAIPGVVAFGGLAVSEGMASLIGASMLMAGSMLISWALSPGQPSAPAYSLTYDPTGPKGLAQPGVPVPKAYGVMGWCGNIISSYVNFDGPNAYIYALACYGFGQAATITDILLNGKPISEYNQCTYYVRLGSNTQTPIDGFNRTVNGYPQETQLLISVGSVIVPGTGTNVQGLQVTVKFPSGLYRITADGNYVPLKLIYLIEVSPHGLNEWQMPLYPWATQTIATVAYDGTLRWPTWVVVPTDRFAGSGIVYTWDNTNNVHSPGDPYTVTEDVTIVNIDSTTFNTSQSFQGEWQPCDPSLEQVQVESWMQGYRVVEADSLSAFFDTISIYGLTPGQWDVKISKTAWEWDNNHYIFYTDSEAMNAICDVWLWNINEISINDLSYPNMILVGVQALATSQMSGADLQITATITHDIGPDTVIPTALASFEHDNPAIVAYDVLANPVYGMGVSASMIDVPAFVAWASFCDQTVTNQDGTTVRRFIFAGVFDQSSDAWKALRTIGAMSRAAVVQMGMRYTVVLDAPADPVQLFTIGNTRQDSFQESWLSLDDRTTLIECDFADAARNYRMDLPVSVMTATDLNSGLAPKPTRTRLIGCTSRDQAWRWAYFQLMSTKLSLRTVQFEAPIEACCCAPGSVIAVQSDVTQWGQGGRVQPGSTLTTLNVERTDLTYAAASGWTVSVQHPLVQRGTATILSISGDVLTMTAPIPAGRIVKLVAPDGTEYIVTNTAASAVTLATLTPLAAAVPLAAGQVVTLYDANVIDCLSVTALTVTPASSAGSGGSMLTVSGSFSAVPTTDSAWAYGQSAGYQPAKLFRVTQMKKSGDFLFQISGLEYNADIYEDVIPNYGEIVGVPDTAPAILNLSLTEQFQNGVLTGSSTSSLVAVGWQNSNTAVGAQVQVQAGSGVWRTIGNIQGQGCTFTGIIGTTYNVRVTGFDWQGNLLGSPATGSITVAASTDAPANISGFAGYSNGTGGTVLAWVAVTPTPDHYEIRYAPQSTVPSWDTAAVLWDGSGTTWTDTTQRMGTYMIVAVSSLATGNIISGAPATWQYGVSNPITLTVPAGTLTAQALSGSVAQITVSPFTPSWGAPCTPSPSILGSLAQAQLYYVYYVDLAFAGGTITPIATMHQADFASRLGYFLIGSVITPTSSTRYQPTTSQDLGSQATSSPALAYDNNLSTAAVVSSSWWGAGIGDGGSTANGDCKWSGFPPVTTAAAITLTVVAALTDFLLAGETASLTITMWIGGVSTTVASLTSPTAQASYTATIPSGTNLSTVLVEVVTHITTATPEPTTGYNYSVSGAITEIYAQ